jgi:hypothetical protein
MPDATPLTRLHRDIDARVHSIRENRPDWLCGKGCDHCCRRLAEIPQLTAAEWALLKEGLAGLAPEHLREIGQRMNALVGQTTRPVVCPLLDHATGACPVYPSARWPVAAMASTCNATSAFIAMTSNRASPTAPWPTWFGATMTPSTSIWPASAKAGH